MTGSRLAWIVLGAAALASCASEPPPAPSRPPSGARSGEARPFRRCPPVFSSPSGEPFRSAPGDAVCPFAAWFAKADANGDGALSREEFRADALRFFRTLDVNGDGVIDGVEVQRYEQLIFPEILGALPPQASAGVRLERAAYLPQMGGYGGGGGGGFGGQPGGGGGGRGGHGGGRGHGSGQGGPPGAGPGSAAGAGRFGLLQEPEPVSAADLNFDGRITADEFATRADQRFHSLDPEDSGRLTLAALKARAPWLDGGRGPGGPHRRHDHPPEA